MNNLSYLIVWCLFAGIIWVGFDIQNQIKSNAQAETKRIEDEAAARVLAEEQKQEDLKKIRVQIKHDNDPTTNTWETKGAIPYGGLTEHACVTVNNKIYLIGGETSGGSKTNTLYVYDPSFDNLNTTISDNCSR